MTLKQKQPACGPEKAAEQPQKDAKAEAAAEQPCPVCGRLGRPEGHH